MRQMLFGAIGAFALVALVATGGCTNKVATDTTAGSSGLIANATVDHVVDGDTVSLIIDGVKERVRLIGIDTPETKRENYPIECFGPEATEFTQSLLPEGREVYVERDVEARDQYGRLLLYLYLVDTGLFVNLEIVRQGYAQPLTIPPDVAHSAEFVAAARAAERADLGLWAACSG